jgi:hypothetical protein
MIKLALFDKLPKLAKVIIALFLIAAIGIIYEYAIWFVVSQLVLDYHFTTFWGS